MKIEMCAFTVSGQITLNSLGKVMFSAQWGIGMEISKCNSVLLCCI